MWAGLSSPSATAKARFGHRSYVKRRVNLVRGQDSHLRCHVANGPALGLGGLDDLGGSPTSTAFGATMHVQVFSFTGSNITFTLRDAATEPTYAAVTGGASSAMTAVGTQRWATSSTQTIRRFLSIGTSGTFSQCTFAVSVSRHLSLAL